MRGITATGLCAALLLIGNVAVAQTPAAPKGASGKPASTGGPARSRPEVPILNLASDDAEEQAEALGGAIRSRIRTMPSVSIDEQSPSLGTIMAALSCNGSGAPDSACLTKIGDHLKVDRFIWGTVKKGPDKKQVTAELHQWRRGKPDLGATEVFSDNLRDQNDDVLRKIAARLVDKVFGQQLSAPVVIRTGEPVAGEVIVDGKERHALANGDSAFEVKLGHHSIEVRATGKRPSTQEIDVVATNGQDLTFRLVAADDATKVEEPVRSHPVSVRTIIGVGLIGVGVAAGVVAGIEGGQFLGLQSKNEDDHKNYNAEDFCKPELPHESTNNQIGGACDRRTRAEQARLLEFIFIGVGVVAAGTGVALLVTAPKSDDRTAAAPKHAAPKLRVSPRLGMQSGGVDLSLKF